MLYRKGMILQLQLLFSSFNFRPPVVRFASRQASHTPGTVYDFSVNDVDGNKVSMEKYKGRVLIIVNVASACSLTDSNYSQLADLHNRLAGRGLSVAAFPCNQFAGQEPWPVQRVRDHVTSRWPIRFDLYAKVDVNGDNEDPLFRFLKTRLTGTFGGFVKWNFTKFLIDRNGLPVKRYGPTDRPADMEADIEELLNEKSNSSV